MWYDFGFAPCTDDYHERNLGALYSKLGNTFFSGYDKSLRSSRKRVPGSPTCSFDEFWKAWENGSLSKVFDKYGIGDNLGGNTRSWFEQKTRFPHLRELLSFPVERHKLRPSVWRLKHLLPLEGNMPLRGFPEIEAAAI